MLELKALMLCIRPTLEVTSEGVPPLPARRYHTAVDPESGQELRYDSTLEPNVVAFSTEGFNRYKAAKALNFSKNNIVVARQILQEFKPR